MKRNTTPAFISLLFAFVFITGTLIAQSKEPAGDGRPEQPRLEVLAAGHNDGINHIAWSPDGKTFASSSNDGTVRLYHARDGSLRDVLRIDKDRAEWAGWSPDGKVIASFALKTLKLWHAGTGRLLRSFTTNDYFYDAAWMTDSRHIMVGGSLHYRVLRVSDGRLVHRSERLNDAAALSPPGDWIAEPIRLKTDSGKKTIPAVRLVHVRDFEVIHLIKGVKWVGWSPDGKRFALTRASRTIEIRRVRDGRLLGSFPGTVSRSSQITWSPDGKTIAWLRDYKFIQIHRSSDGKFLREIPTTESVYELKWSPRGNRLAATFRDRVKIWSAMNNPRDRAGPTVQIKTGARRTAWSPNGETLATGGDDYSINLWRVRDGSRLFSRGGNLLLHRGPHWSGKSLATIIGGDRVTVLIWRPRKNKLLELKNAAYAAAAKWSPNGRFYAATPLDRGKTSIRDARDGRVLQTLQHGSYRIYELAWSPDGTRIVSVTSDTLEVFRVRDGKQIHAARPGDYMSKVWWSPDGRAVIAKSNYGTVYIHRARDMRLLATLKDVRSLNFLPDRRAIVYIAGKKNPVLRIRNTSDTRVLKTFRGMRHDAATIFPHPSGKYLALGSKPVRFGNPGNFNAKTKEHRIEIRRADNGRRIKSFRGHGKGMWSPDGSVLYTWNDTKFKAYRWRGGKLLYEFNLASPRWFKIRDDGKLIATFGYNKLIHIREASSGRIRATLRMFSDGIAVISTPDGRFDYTRPAGEKYIHFRVGGKFAQGDELRRLRKRFRVPGLMREILQ